jgi:hypothetical protein
MKNKYISKKSGMGMKIMISKNPMSPMIGGASNIEKLRSLLSELDIKNKKDRYIKV